MITISTNTFSGKTKTPNIEELTKGEDLCRRGFDMYYPSFVMSMDWGEKTTLLPNANTIWDLNWFTIYKNIQMLMCM